MSAWVERITSSPVWQAMEDFRLLMEQAIAREGINSDSIDGLERLRSVLAFCEKRLAAMDPVLLEPAALAKIGSGWTAAQGELSAFLSDGDQGHIASANGHGDGVLRNLSTVLAPGGGDELSAIGEAASAYRATLQTILDELQKTNAGVKRTSVDTLAKLNELGTQVGNEKEKIAAALSEQQSQFVVAQTNRGSEFATAQSERQANHSSAIAEIGKLFAEAQAERQEKFTTSSMDFQAQFTAAQEERAKSESTAQSERQSTFSALMVDYTEKLGERNAQLTTQITDSDRIAKEALAELKVRQVADANGLLDQINIHRRAVEKLVGVIGNLGVTSGYQLVANHARWALYIWQFLTVAALGGLVWVAYLIAFTPHTVTANFVEGFATRIFLSIAIGVFAAYAASQADKASITERRNRKLALELEAVGPYIAPLPEAMQNKFRADLGERSFGVPEFDGKKPGEGSPSPATPLDVLNSKEVRALVDAAVDKAIKTTLDRLGKA
jgi:hypothetical protein